MKIFKKSKLKSMIAGIVMSVMCSVFMGNTAFAATPANSSVPAIVTVATATGTTTNVATAVESTWKDASGQIKQVVNNVVFPAVDLILAIFFFVNLGMCYFEYRKHGQFDWAPPAILFACLVFMMTAPLYIWGILGM